MATEDDWKKIAKAVDVIYQRPDAGKNDRADERAPMPLVPHNNISLTCFSFVARTIKEPFREPVAWKELNLTDYPKVIEHPMDLGTIKDKLKKRAYATPADLHKDVLLVWSNCMTYNQDGSDFYKLAGSLKKKWEDRYNKLVKDMNVKEAATAPAQAMSAAAPGSSAKAGGSKASLADRRTFAKSLFALTKEDLGKVRW